MSTSKDSGRIKPMLRHRRQNVQGSTTLSQSSNSYMNFSIPRQKTDLSWVCFPYCMEASSMATVPSKQQVRISNRVYENERENEKHLTMIYKIQNQPVPVNEYLSYELSEEINTGLYEVKILAEEIKQIKQKKLEMLQDKNRYRPTNRIRIKKLTQHRKNMFY